MFTEKYKELFVLNDLRFLKDYQNNLKWNNIIPKEIKKFEDWHRKCLLKVKSFLIKWIYLRRKRNKYYKTNINKLILV